MMRWATDNSVEEREEKEEEEHAISSVEWFSFPSIYPLSRSHVSREQKAFLQSIAKTGPVDCVRFFVVINSILWQVLKHPRSEDESKLVFLTINDLLHW